MAMSNAELSHCLIAGNSAECGGGVFCGPYRDTQTDIRNCTIVGNRASQRGGGVLCRGGRARIDGSILFDIRQASGPHRHKAVSRDGGRTWAEPQPGEAVSPVACAIERWTLKSAGDDRDRILWTGPKGPKRTNLVARVSYDEGKTFPLERPISEQFAAYSDLTVLPDKTAGVLWERGVDRGYQFITFTAFNLDFAEPDR